MIEEKVEAFVKEANAEFGDEILKTDEIKPDKWEGSTKEDGSPDCISILETGKGHVYVDLQTGEIVTKLDRPWIATLRKRMDAPPKANQANVLAVAEHRRSDRVIVPHDMPVRDVQVAELTVGMIRDYLCPMATEQEAYVFLQICQARGLNPFLSEVYLIKYNEKDKAQIVTGKDAFTRRAAETPEFRYFRAGVIVQKGDEVTEREGTFFAKSEELIGGWAEVYLEGREVPFKYTIRREEFDKKQANWLKMPGVMCRKCALVGALREALPEQLGGLYDSAEMRDAPDIIDLEGDLIDMRSEET